MKRFSFFLLLLFFVCSCKKSADTSVQPMSTKSLIPEVEGLSQKLPAQKLAYKMLSPDARLALWQTQFDYYLGANLNDDQKHTIRELRNFLTADMFVDGVFAQKYDAFAKNWDKAAQSIFPQSVLQAIESQVHTQQYCIDLVDETDAAHYVSSNLSIQSIHRLVTNTVSESGVQDCTCSTKSFNYCAQFERCSSTFFECHSVPFCGFILAYTCNGTCISGA